MNVTVTNGSTALVRNVTVSYTTSVNTIFGAVLGMSTLPMSGISQASAQIPPNIDFYVLLDNSPSMSLPATAAGITEMQNLTTKQGGGCAFACHQASTNNGDTAGNPCADGTAPTLLTWRRRRRRAARSTATRRNTARRSTITRSRARTASRSVSTS